MAVHLFGCADLLHEVSRHFGGKDSGDDGDPESSERDVLEFAAAAKAGRAEDPRNRLEAARCLMGVFFAPGVSESCTGWAPRGPRATAHRLLPRAFVEQKQKKRSSCSLALPSGGPEAVTSLPVAVALQLKRSSRAVSLRRRQSLR